MLQQVLAYTSIEPSVVFAWSGQPSFDKLRMTIAPVRQDCRSGGGWGHPDPALKGPGPGFGVPEPGWGLPDSDLEDPA